MANPPAPDVEAIARRLRALAARVPPEPGVRVDDEGAHWIEVADDFLDEAASALTAHAAASEARVRELERERSRDAVALKMLKEYWDKETRNAEKAEAEANRLREALERISQNDVRPGVMLLNEDGYTYRPMEGPFAKIARAALTRQADEPGTQREM